MIKEKKSDEIELLDKWNNIQAMIESRILSEEEAKRIISREGTFSTKEINFFLKCFTCKYKSTKPFDRQCVNCVHNPMAKKDNYKEEL